MLTQFPYRVHEVDFCVVGGGMAGVMAALAAARNGARVVLMHDRPVLGGNASSETRVHICGADRHNWLADLRETGALEELRLENLYRNPQSSWGIWDTVLFELVRYQPNLTLLLNCSCIAAEMHAGQAPPPNGPRIAAVRGWQLTTQTVHEVRAKVFADCSGDAVLAPLTGAAFRVGREGRDEYGEPSAPDQADRKTMGMSICFQTRRYDTPQPFEPPSWAHRFDSCEDLPYGPGGHGYWGMGYWWVELGGEQDSIHDTEALRDELLKIAYGVWDHIKNRCGEHRDAAANWAIDWMQFLPAKRESRRYLGAAVLTQNDILAGGRFDDLVAYGGWTMDEHPPHGFWGRKRGSKLPSAVHHETPSPYGIPYRSLYARDLANLMFAGRCHSASHLAMSSTRVMGTGCSMGEAVGTAAAMAVRLGCDPAGIGEHIDQLQQSLLAADCYLPGVKQRFGPLTTAAALETSAGDAEAVRDGVNRPVGGERHAWRHNVGDSVTMRLPAPAEVAQLTLIVDSALHRDVQMSYHNRPQDHLHALPPELPRTFHVEVQAGGQWQSLHRAENSRRRMLRIAIHRRIEAVRYTLDATWQPCDGTNLYAMYVD
jgi:hypothetical protein